MNNYQLNKHFFVIFLDKFKENYAIFNIRKKWRLKTYAWLFHNFTISPIFFDWELLVNRAIQKSMQQWCRILVHLPAITWSMFRHYHIVERSLKDPMSSVRGIAIKIEINFPTWNDSFCIDKPQNGLWKYFPSLKIFENEENLYF